MSMPALNRTAAGQVMRSARVTYHSTSGDGGVASVVTGAVFTPRGPVPPGGWPVVAVGHGTTGIDEPCAVSTSTTLLGQAPLVGALVQAGYAVALSDYQGLGAPGIHPYLDSQTAGRNLIDSVRALRATFPDVSDRWVGFGGSQGGGAAWSADEQASSYAPELTLLGAMAISPVTNVSALVDEAQAGTVNADQIPVLVGVVETQARLHPDTIDRDDFRDETARRYWDAVVACAGPLMADRGDAVAHLRASDVAPRSPAAAQRLRDLLTQWALPQRPLSAPLSVQYGGKDTLIDPQWTRAAVQRACELGGTVNTVFDPDAGHGHSDPAYALKWIADRFAGHPATSDCTPPRGR